MKSKEKEMVRVTTVVALDSATAFSVFTEEIGSWWKPTVLHLFREGHTGVMKFEPGPNGRLLEVYADAPDDPFVVGRVLVWTPGKRLAFEWRQLGFGRKDVTEVDVQFEPMESGTRVTLEHSGWDSIPKSNRSRHGWSGEAFAAMVAMRWGNQLVLFRAHTAREKSRKVSNV